VAVESFKQLQMENTEVAATPIAPAVKAAEQVIKIIQNKRRALPHRRKGYTQKASIGGHKVTLELVNTMMALSVKFLSICIKKVQPIEV
jgi:hypothetical protein